MARLVTLAVIEGGGVTDPENNIKLRMAIEKAKSLNFPKENIDRAIEKGLGPDRHQLKEVIYEAGTEEHGGHITEPSDFENFVKNIKDVSPKIKFVVGNVGLYVKERKNTGMLNQTRAEKLVKICNQNNLYLKCHNVDYVNSHQNNGIVWRLNQLGVHAINIAPEIGVQETETLLYTWRSHGYFEEAEKFIELAYKSGKWFKWMTNKGDVKSKEERAIIAGHYIFNYWAVEEMRKYINKKEGGNIEERVKFMIMSNIRDYLMNLNWEVK